MKLKRIISSALTLAMLASTALIGVTSVTAADELPFDDVPAKWFKNAVVTVYNEGIMQGKSDTKFDPTANITRAEVVTAFARIACTNIDGKGDKLTFTDTKTGKWYSDSVGWAADNGIVKGRGDGRFSPSDNITRAELASIIINFVNYMELKLPDNPKIDKFSDAGTFANWMKEPVEAVRKTGLMQGVDGKFNPKGNATRAEIAQVIANLLPSTGRVNVVENGISEYVIVASADHEDAAYRLQYQIQSTTGATLEVADGTKSNKAIFLGNTSVATDGLGTDGYEVQINGENVYIDGETPEGVYRGAVRFALTCTSGDDVRFTPKSAERDEFKYPIGKLTINGNDISKYKIVYPENASANTMLGVNDLVEYIEKATGVKLETTTAESEYAIIVDETTVVVDGSYNDNIENFSVKSEGNSIRISGDAARGAMYGCYDFLEDVVGWIFLTEEQDYISPKDELDIKDIDYTETPGIKSRETYCYTYIGFADMRNKHKMWVSPDTARCGHAFESLTNGKYNQETQPCLTDPEIRDLMRDNVLKILQNNPNIAVISVGQNDNMDYCKCENCTALAEEEGSLAGPVINLVNYISDAVVAAGYKDVKLTTYAYNWSVEAPKTPPRDNVVIQFCTMEACLCHPLSNLCNRTIITNINNWRELGAHISVWEYIRSFNCAPIPIPNFRYETLASNIRFYAEQKTEYVFEQGNHINVKENGDFDRLRAYIVAKLLWDPYMTEEEYDAQVKKFMEGYYGEGWELIYEAMNLWFDAIANAHFDCWVSEFNSINLNYMRINSTLLELFDSAELMTESKVQFENTDRSQIQFDFMNVNSRFDSLYNSGDEEKIAESQKISLNLQNKLLKYEVSLRNMYIQYPNMTEFTIRPDGWRNIEEPGLIVTSIDQVTVDYPKR